VFKHVRYGGRGVVGIALCLTGAFLWLRDEAIDSRQQSGEISISSVLLGDMLACGAAFLYGLNDVVAEYYVKSCDQEEYLGMLGLFGSILSFGLQVPMLECDQLREMIARANVAPWNELIVAIFLLACFVGFLYCFYNLVLVFLAEFEATILNLSLQTCPLLAVMAQKILSDGDGAKSISQMQSSFFISLGFVFAGMCLYESQEGETEEQGQSRSLKTAWATQEHCSSST